MENNIDVRKCQVDEVGLQMEGDLVIYVAAFEVPGGCYCWELYCGKRMTALAEAVYSSSRVIVNSMPFSSLPTPFVFRYRPCRCCILITKKQALLFFKCHDRSNIHGY